MNPKHLETLVSVADRGSIAAAAQVVGLSHSAASLHIKALEEACGAPLLDRRRKPPTLTARGKLA
ncbi:MAG: LysR family transcriptional regulator [Pseudomonadota bacterium]